MKLIKAFQPPPPPQHIVVVVVVVVVVVHVLTGLVRDMRCGPSLVLLMINDTPTLGDQRLSLLHSAILEREHSDSAQTTMRRGKISTANGHF